MVHDPPKNLAKNLEIHLEFFWSTKKHYLIHSPFAIPAKCTSYLSTSFYPHYYHLDQATLISPIYCTSFPNGLPALLPHWYFSKEKLEWSLKKINQIMSPFLRFHRSPPRLLTLMPYMIWTFLTPQLTLVIYIFICLRISNLVPTTWFSQLAPPSLSNAQFSSLQDRLLLIF